MDEGRDRPRVMKKGRTKLAHAHPGQRDPPVASSEQISSAAPTFPAPAVALSSRSLQSQPHL